nr:hypothetical protein [Lachnospiraceae bacterium]
GWSRRGISINEFGIVSDSGSNGAGSHVDDTYAPDQDYVYHTVSSVEENYIGWDFYDENAQPIDALNNTMHQVEETYPELVEKVCFYKEIIDGKTYFYYLGTDKITQDTVDKIDGIAKENGFTFDGKAAADEARVAYAVKLGVDEAIKSLAEPAWKSLN